MGPKPVPVERRTETRSKFTAIASAQGARRPLSLDDLRWLVASGYAQHGQELTQPSEGRLVACFAAQ